jgi:sec-independent protein translocase protein TatC
MIDHKEMPFLDHLEELRWRSIKIIASVFVLTVISFFVSDFFLDFLLYPSKRITTELDLQVLKVQTIFIIKLEIALIIGIVLSIPVIFYQLWAFVAPGLLERERKWVWPTIIVIIISFLAGVSFAYFLIIPYALDFFLSLAPETVQNNIAIDFYFGFILRIILVFGVVFELPVVSLFLTKIGLLTPQFLRKYRRYAVITIFVMAALLTPPDPTTQVMLGIPLVILYEFTIWISYVFAKKRKENE